MNIEKYNVRLQPSMYVVAQELHVFYSIVTPVRLYSKYRKTQVDPGIEWDRYASPRTGRQWEYKSGPQGRKARWLGEEAVDV